MQLLSMDNILLKYNLITKVVNLRGEHLVNLCDYLNGVRLKWDESMGYSSTFAEKHDEILKDIIDNPNKLIKIVTGLDDICNYGVCPNKKEKCQSPELKERDKSYALKYGLVAGKKYRSKELIKLLREQRWSLK